MSDSTLYPDDPEEMDPEGVDPEGTEGAPDAPAEAAVGEAEGEPTGRRGRLDRVEHRAAMQDLKDLANRLAKLPRGQRRTLPLDEELQEELDRLASAAGMSHRRRLVMRVKLLLGAADLVRLQAVLDGDTDTAALERVLQQWRTRILAGDDATLQLFIDAYPHSDRQALRTAAREARKQGAVATRANARLLQLLREGALARGEG